jgi:hypothetical protein
MPIWKGEDHLLMTDLTPADFHSKQAAKSSASYYGTRTVMLGVSPLRQPSSLVVGPVREARASA